MAGNERTIRRHGMTACDFWKMKRQTIRYGVQSLTRSFVSRLFIIATPGQLWPWAAHRGCIRSQNVGPCGDSRRFRVLRRRFRFLSAGSFCIGSDAVQVAAGGVGGQRRCVRSSHRIWALSAGQLTSCNRAARSYGSRARGLLARCRSNRSCDDGPITRPVLAVSCRGRGLADRHRSARVSCCTCCGCVAGSASNEALSQIAS